jgi:hypothetical protein
MICKLTSHFFSPIFHSALVYFFFKVARFGFKSEMDVERVEEKR